MTVPPGAESVTCDGVKVAGLISSLNVTWMLEKPVPPAIVPLGVDETTYGPSVLATAAAALTMPPDVTLPTSCGVGRGRVEDRVDHLAHRPGRVRGLHQGDRAGDQRRGHRRAAVRRVSAVRG